jgi:ATP-dependent RNA helicase DHX29
MAKKKKTALKPVARGFATTSVPKKVVEPVEDVVDSSTAAEDANTSDATASHQGNGAAPADSVAVLSAEEQALQSLTEKLQEKTEKEVIRVVKVIMLFMFCALTNLSF